MANEHNVVAFPQKKRDRRRLKNARTDRRLLVVSRLRRVFGWLLLLSVALFCAANFTLFSMDSLRSAAGFLKLGASKGEALDVVALDGGPAVDASAFGDGVAILSSDTLTVRQPGAAGQSLQLAYSAPMLDVADGYALAYDQGGLSATLVTSVSTASTQTLKSPILTGAVSPSGNYVLLTDESGYRTAATVFSSDGKQLFKWATPDYYFQTAALSDDGKTLALVGFRQQGTALESTLFLRSITSEDQMTTVPLGSTVGLAARYLSGGTLALIGDDRCLFAGADGTILSEMSYTADDLTVFAFGEDAVALALRSYSGAARCELFILTPAADDETEPPALLLSEELQSLSFADHRLAVLTAGGLYCYTSELEPLWKNTEAAGASRVLLSDDGAVWVLYAKQAVRCTASSDHSEEF